MARLHKIMRGVEKVFASPKAQSLLLEVLQIQDCTLDLHIEFASTRCVTASSLHRWVQRSFRHPLNVTVGAEHPQRAAAARTEKETVAFWKGSQAASARGTYEGRAWQQQHHCQDSGLM